MSKYRSITKDKSWKNIEESKLARESSNFDQYLAKEKLQRSLNKPPLGSRELPKVKGVHDVEVPKYNREQILKNLEESKLARKSSKFDNYLRKEYAQQGKYFAERISWGNGKYAYLSRILIRQQETNTSQISFLSKSWRFYRLASWKWLCFR